MLVRSVSMDSLGSQACTGWDMCPASLLSAKRKKTSGTEVRRTLDVKSRVVGFIRFVGFNYGHIQ